MANLAKKNECQTYLFRYLCILNIYIMLKFYQSYLQFISVISPKLASNIAFKLFCTPINKKLRDREIEIIKSAKAENIPFEDIYIKKYTWGNGNKTALLVHGWESNAGSLGAFVQLLTENNYKVIGFDCPAHGQSGGKQTTLFRNSDAALLICNQLDHIDIAITHSFGSVVLMNAILHNKSISLDKLVMITTPNELQKAFNDFYDLLKINNRVRLLMEQKIEKRYNIKIKEMTASVLCHQLHLKHAIIVHDKQDKVIPFNNAEIVAKNLKNCQLVPIENAGHYKILWDKRVVDLVAKEIN
jgi:pimeloyl-ACP methyl ester carboxylesterase